MHIDDMLFDDDSNDDDALMPGMEALLSVLETTSDPLALPTLAELLLHPDPRVRTAALEAIQRLRPRDLDLRRQLTPRALRRVRRHLNPEGTRATRKARATLAASRARAGEKEEGADEGDDDDLDPEEDTA